MYGDALDENDQARIVDLLSTSLTALRVAFRAELNLTHEQLLEMLVMKDQLVDVLAELGGINDTN